MSLGSTLAQPRRLRARYCRPGRPYGRVKGRPSELTALQVETLRCLAQGLTVAEIAAKRGVSAAAVYEVLRYAQDAMGARTREQLVAQFVAQRGIDDQRDAA